MVVDNGDNDQNKTSFSILTFHFGFLCYSFLVLILMSSFRLDTSFNSLTITSKSSVSKTTTTTTTNRRLLDVDPHRLSVINAANMTASGIGIHQRRTSIVNHHHQRRNSQLRKASFAASTLVCVTEYN